MISIKQLLLFTLIFSCTSLHGQSDIKTFTVKKGEVLDFLFINEKANSDSVKSKYFKSAFPVAKKFGYTPLGGLATKETPTQGNYSPDVVALGKWPSVAAREVALEELENEVEDFHQMRREIWSNFNVLYFEVKNDITFEIKPDRYYVLTTFWEKSNKRKFKQYVKNWNSEILAINGVQIIELTDGNSPFGYQYTPNYISISSWKSEMEFNKFLNASEKMDEGSLGHVNQFRIQ